MNNLSLYQITSAFPVLMESEEITEDIKEQIKEELHQLLENKSKNIIGYIRNTDLTIEAMKQEEKRIAEIRKTLERKQENFKTYVKECMNQNEITKVERRIDHEKSIDFHTNNFIVNFNFSIHNKFVARPS